MKKSPKGPWVIIMMALLLVAVILILGNQSFKATEKAAFDEFNQRQLVLARGAAGGIDLYFETLAGDMRAVGRMPQVQHLDEVPTRREIQHTFDQAEYSYYKYEDSSGQYNRDEKEENLIAYAPIHLGNEVWAIGVWAPKEDARQLIQSAYLGQLFVVGLSLLTILLGSSYSLVAFYRTSKFLEKEVETKTGELKESHERLLTVLDSLDAVVYVADMETYEILFVNKYLRNLVGHVVGQTCWQTLQVGQSGPCDFCTNEKLLVASGEPSGVYGWEFQNMVTGRWYEIRDRAIRWVDGRIVRLEIAIDITEGKRVEEALEAAHAFQQAIIDGVAESIMVIGIDYRVQLMNRAAREFSSGGADASESLLCHQISHQRETPCDGTEHPCPLEQVRQSGQPVTVVHEHYQANGEWRVVEVLASPLWGADGAFQGIIESARDITERVRAEEALEAARAFQQSLIDEERGRIARELHDGLAQLLGYVSTKAMAVRLMLKNRQTEAADQHLLQLEEAARELYVDVRQAILDLKMTGQSDAGLTATLKDFAAQFSRLSGLPVELAIAPAVESLSLTAETELQLLRIVQEALTNVRKHASATKVWISLRLNDGVLELTVSDDGQGFDPDHVPTTHWPHFGLSTMHERAEAIGAEFDLDSELGAGTRIMVRLPVVSNQ
jgi:PAS domain S-box-containing protein